MAELIQGKMIAGSPKAILMEINGEEIWIPKGQIECMKGFKVIIAISDWCAWTKGLISDSEYDKRKNEYGIKQEKQQVQSEQSEQQKQPEQTEQQEQPEQTDLPF